VSAESAGGSYYHRPVGSEVKVDVQEQWAMVMTMQAKAYSSVNHKLYMLGIQIVRCFWPTPRVVVPHGNSEVVSALRRTHASGGCSHRIRVDRGGAPEEIILVAAVESDHSYRVIWDVEKVILLRRIIGILTSVAVETSIKLTECVEPSKVVGRVDLVEGQLPPRPP
jgi:hypothetical protein